MDNELVEVGDILKRRLKSRPCGRDKHKAIREHLSQSFAGSADVSPPLRPW